MFVVGPGLSITYKASTTMRYLLWKMWKMYVVFFFLLLSLSLSIYPLIEHVCALRMQHTLVPALTEIEMHEENKDTSFLSEEYAHILAHRDEIANQDLDLSRLIRSVRNLYVNANMFRGRDVQTRSAQLTKMIEDGYDLDRICAFMEVDGGK